MDERHCDMKRVRTPFRATGLELLPPHRTAQGDATKAAIPVGSRGVRQLASQKSKGGPTPTAALPSAAALASPLRVASFHHDGQLLIWDCARNALVAACEHGVGTSVVQCIAGDAYLFVRLESAPGNEGSEDDTNVHVWSAQTFKRAFTLRGHESRLTAMALCDAAPHVLATASLDRTVRVWNTNESTASPAQTLSLDRCGTISGMAFVCGADVLVASGSICPLTVWHWQTKQVLAAASEDTARATTVLRVVPAALSRAKAPQPQRRGSSTVVMMSPLSVFVGCTDGFVREHTLQLERTTGPPVVGGAADAQRVSWKGALAHGWQGKSHTATVESLFVDGDVVATCSMYDGAYAVNRATGVARLLGPRSAAGVASSIGCTALALDSANKRLLVGAHTGEVFVWNYAEFATGASKEVHLVSSFTPHNSAVTGICLELSSGNVWERLLTCGGEGDISVLDYRCSTRMAVTLPSRPNSAVLARLVLDDGQGSATPALTLLSASTDAVTEPALCVADEKTMRLIADGSRGLNLGKSVVTAVWSAPTSELLVATSDAVVTALLFQADSGWRKTRQWVLKSDHTVTCTTSVCGNGLVGLGMISRRGEDGAIALLSLQGDAATTPAAASDFTTSGMSPRSVTLVTGRAPDAASVVAEMTDGSVRVYTWTPHVTTLQAGPILCGARPVPAGAPVRCGRMPTMALKADPTSVSGGVVLLVPSNKTLLMRRAFPNGVVQDLPDSPATFSTNVLSVTAVHQSGIDWVVLCEHSSEAYLCDAKGVPTHVLSHTGAITPVTSAGSDAKKAAERHRSVSYPTPSSAGKSNDPARAPHCIYAAFEQDRRYIALAYSNGLIQLVDTSYKYVFARLWGPEGPFSAATITDIAAVGDYVVASTEQCPLTALPVPHRALMDTAVK